MLCGPLVRDCRQVLLRVRQIPAIVLCPPSQAFVTLGDFEHGAPGRRINYFHGKPAGIFGTVAPVLRIVEEFFGHVSTRLLLPHITIRSISSCVSRSLVRS
jgi:hypothetical protein